MRYKGFSITTKKLIDGYVYRIWKGAGVTIKCLMISDDFYFSRKQALDEAKKCINEYLL